MTKTVLAQRRDEILRVAEQHGAGNVRLFGSVARGEAHPDTDIDLLVELAPDRTLLDLAALRDDLERLLDQAVDVVTEGGAGAHQGSRPG